MWHPHRLYPYQSDLQGDSRRGLASCYAYCFLLPCSQQCSHPVDFCTLGWGVNSILGNSGAVPWSAGRRGAFIGFLALLSIALISPLSANRALPVRIFATAVWIPTAIGAAIWSIGVNNLTPIAVWATLNILLYSIGLFVRRQRKGGVGTASSPDYSTQMVPPLLRIFLL